MAMITAFFPLNTPCQFRQKMTGECAKGTGSSLQENSFFLWFRWINGAHSIPPLFPVLRKLSLWSKLGRAPRTSLIEELREEAEKFLSSEHG